MQEEAGIDQGIKQLLELNLVIILFCMVVVVSELANQQLAVSWALSRKTRSSSGPKSRFTLNLGLKAPNIRLKASLTTCTKTSFKKTSTLGWTLYSRQELDSWKTISKFVVSGLAEAQTNEPLHREAQQRIFTTLCGKTYQCLASGVCCMQMTARLLN